jgi:protein-S-isoprenylcysteine O-methyltransferase Ste14
MTLQALELKIPPPAVAVIAGVAMWGIAATVPHETPPAVRIAVACVIAAFGVATAAAGVMAFRLANTTINPTKPDASSALVSSGVYRITRNPMYLGLLLLLLAFAIYLFSVWALPIPLLFVAYLDRFQIAPEERALSRLFGAHYAAYKIKVRRWI